jgi:hypothetical protein
MWQRSARAYICETSNRLAFCLVHSVDSTIVISLYVTGILNPPNSTIFPPLETWKSYNCVLLGAASLLLYRTFLRFVVVVVVVAVVVVVV